MQKQRVYEEDHEVSYSDDNGDMLGFDEQGFL
jgi:hypothetical protein